MSYEALYEISKSKFRAEKKLNGSIKIPTDEFRIIEMDELKNKS